MPTPKYSGPPQHYVVVSRAHALELFPEDNRWPLRNACQEFIDRDGACLATLAPGEFKIRPLANAGDVQRQGVGRVIPLKAIRSGSSVGRAAD